MNKEKEKILLLAQKKYFENGFYKTSMDSLSSKLKISKKTIYKYFPTKDKLVKEVVHNFMNYMSTSIDEIINRNENAVVKTLLLIDLMSDTILKFSESWVRDISFHTPKLWQKVDRFRSEKMFGVLSKIIEQGKKENLFYNKPTEIIITIFVSSIRSIVNPDFLLHKKYPYKEALQAALEILFNGILTPKGKRIFYKSFKKVNG